MKKSAIALTALSVMTLVLTSCGGGANKGPTLPNDPALVSNYKHVSDVKQTVTFNDVRTGNRIKDVNKRKGRYECEANQAGDVHALVVPIEFNAEGETADDLPAGREGTLDDIEKMFFGDPTVDKELEWESLKSFYFKSSFGKCKFDGDVMPWYNVGCSAKELEQKEFHAPMNLVKELHTFYFEGEGKKLLPEGRDLSWYDANNDGYVDIFYMIYSIKERQNTTGGSPSSMYWAFCTQFSNDRKTPEDPTDAYFSRYIWMSYNFMYQNAKNGVNGAYYTREEIANNAPGCIDAHTLIHETGHGLGLPDYYETEYAGYAPMGALDMMDNNIGDHSAYNKLCYDWIDPYIVTGPARITLKPFQENGDAIIIPIRDRNWFQEVNGHIKDEFSIMDEYLMLEFMTPTGLWQKDGERHYRGHYPLFYNALGVRVTHVDSRYGAWSYDSTTQTNRFDGYTKSVQISGDRFCDFAHSNTKSRTANGQFQFSVVHRDGVDHEKGTVHNEVLWQPGDYLLDKVMHSQDRKTDEQLNLGYGFRICDMNEEGVTIEAWPSDMQ